MFNLIGTENAVMIENIDASSVEVALLLYESNKTGGEPIDRHKYFEDQNLLVIYYQSADIANRVIQHDPVRLNGKLYKAKAYKKSSLETGK